jgi:hypothetical protein
MWGTEADMRELMRRHEVEGMGAFAPDDSVNGRLLVKTMGGERWIAPCGCAVSISAPDDAHARPAFLTVAEHF